MKETTKLKKMLSLVLGLALSASAFADSYFIVPRVKGFDVYVKEGGLDKTSMFFCEEDKKPADTKKIRFYETFDDVLDNVQFSFSPQLPEATKEQLDALVDALGIKEDYEKFSKICPKDFPIVGPYNLTIVIVLKDESLEKTYKKVLGKKALKEIQKKQIEKGKETLLKNYDSKKNTPVEGFFFFN